MNQRYTVYDNNEAFAYINAASPKEAVQIACAKTDAHDPENCVALPTKKDSLLSD